MIPRVLWTFFFSSHGIDIKVSHRTPPRRHSPEATVQWSRRLPPDDSNGNGVAPDDEGYIYIMNNMAKTVSKMYGESVVDVFLVLLGCFVVGEEFVCLFGTNTLCLLFVGR